MDKEHILSEIKKTAEENGGVPLGRSRFETETGINQWDWCGKFWSRWNDAVNEAGDKWFVRTYIINALFSKMFKKFL